MIDSHCHLADKKFSSDLEDVIARAEENGVDALVTIADSLEEGKKCLKIAEKYDQVFCTIGVHPHVAKTWKEEDRETLKKMLLSSSNVKALGEIGLDYHYDNSPRPVQQSVFRTQLELAKELDLPVVIHNRDSFDDLWNIMTDVAPAKAVLHCCTDRWEDAKKFVEKGWLLSFTGIATYPNADVIRDTIKNCPLDQMMIETDAPYLTPVPHRGKRNEPAFVVEVARLIGEVKGLSLQEVDEQTSKNAVGFYGLGM